MRPVRATAAVASLALAAFAAAPAAAGDDAEVDEPVVLRMGSPYHDPRFVYTPAVFDFVDEVARLSDGAMTIEMVYGFPASPHFADLPDGEQQVVEAAVDGELELAWVTTRIFDAVGVSSFDALEAPFLVDSYPLQAAILDSDLPERMLAGLDEIGLTGLAVLAGGLRKPVAVDAPLLGPDDWAGITFQHYRSALHADAISALGATPTDVLAGGRDAGLVLGEIHGHEHTLMIFVARGNYTLAPYVTANVNLWPEALAVLANPDVLAGLDDTQAGWLRQAAVDAAASSVDLADVDDELLTEACAGGARFADASDEDLAALRQAVQPVYNRLAEDPETAALIAEIEALAEGIDTDPLEIPDDCVYAG